jgi:hypothetical protein
VTNLGFEQALSSSNALLSDSVCPLHLYTTYCLQSYSSVIEGESKKGVEDDAVFLQVFMHKTYGKSFAFEDNSKENLFYLGKIHLYSHIFRLNFP